MTYKVCYWDSETQTQKERDATPDEVAEIEARAIKSVDESKAAKLLQINAWRAAANKTFFTYSGKQIACDDLSRGDIDAVAGSIALTGAFPAGFPGAWKAMDNSYVALPDVAAFKSLYAAMTAQGTANFAHAQSLKAAVASAGTVVEINAVVW